jgi:hypothetical protein
MNYFREHILQQMNEEAINEYKTDYISKGAGIGGTLHILTSIKSIKPQIKILGEIARHDPDMIIPSIIGVIIGNALALGGSMLTGMGLAKITEILVRKLPKQYYQDLKSDMEEALKNKDTKAILRIRKRVYRDLDTPRFQPLRKEMEKLAKK